MKEHSCNGLTVQQGCSENLLSTGNNTSLFFHVGDKPTTRHSASPCILSIQRLLIILFHIVVFSYFVISVNAQTCSGTFADVQGWYSFNGNTTDRSQYARHLSAQAPIFVTGSNNLGLRPSVVASCAKLLAPFALNPNFVRFFFIIQPFLFFYFLNYIVRRHVTWQPNLKIMLELCLTLYVRLFLLYFVSIVFITNTLHSVKIHHQLHFLFFMTQAR